MRHTLLIWIGLAWLLAVIAELRFFDHAIAIGFLVSNPFKAAAALVGMSLLWFCCLFLLIGWIAPLAVGIYQLVRRR